MTVEAAIRELRAHFRRKAHPHDCICACCEAIEVLASTWIWTGRVAAPTEGETDG